MSRTTFYSVNYLGWPPVPIREAADANSQYWREMAMAAGQRLADRIGYDDYCAWVDSLDDFTWLEFFNYCQEKLDELAASGLVGDHPYSQDSTQIDSCHRISGGKND